MSLVLCLHIHSAEVELPFDASLLVKASINGLSKTTSRQPVSKPSWNEDLNFELQYAKGDLWVELYSASFMRQQLLGYTTIPLYSVRYSRKQSVEWYDLTPSQYEYEGGGGRKDSLRVDKGGGTGGNHSLSFDVHFELPRNIPPKDLEILEKKLNSLHKTLGEEVKTISHQQSKINSKTLPLPDKLPGKFKYPDEVKKATPINPFPRRKRSIAKSVSFEKEEEREEERIQEEEIEGIRPRTFSAKEKWRLTLQDPNFLKMKTSLKTTQHMPTRTRSSSLAKLVTHLQEIKKIEQYIPPDDKDVGSFSEKVHRRLKPRKSLEGLHIVKETIDEDFRVHVYKKALQAMIYPASSLHAHSFVEKTYRSFTYCGECEGFIWGLTKQGVQCERCGKNSHKKCAMSAKHDCFHIRDSTSVEQSSSQLSVISQLMDKTVQDARGKFDLLRIAFSVTPLENNTITEEVKGSIKDLARKFSATVHIKVVAAQGLAINETEDKRIYVSVDIGGDKKRTKAYKESHHSPQWSEDFQFDCHNFLEPIKIRVWNERHNTMSKLTNKITSEGDHFLGQKVIEVLKLGAPSTLWYKLEKRTPDNIVSGAIQLTLSSVITGEFLIAPYHIMYSQLHEQLFLHLHVRESNPLVICSTDHREKCLYLPGEAQSIIDEFANRYSVETIYRSLVHFQLILDNSLRVDHIGAVKALNSLLVFVKEYMFFLSAEENAIRGVGLQTLMIELFDSCNFDRDKISQLLMKLNGQLLVNLQNYRDVFPVTNKKKLSELSDTCQLLRTVVEFQMQAIHTETAVSLSKLSFSIEEAMKESMRVTFDDIVNLVMPEDYQGHPALKKDSPPYEFYYSIIKQIISAVVEDKTVYQPYIKNYVDFDLEAVSLLEFWNQFKVTIKELFQVDDHLNVFPPIEAIHLLLTVKKFYEERVRKFLSKDAPLEYPYWFEPAVKYWIQDFQQSAMNFINNSWDHDKAEEFRSDNQNFSCSAYDMFVYFHKGQEVIRGLDAGQTDLRHVYLNEYSKVIKSLIIHYIDVVSVEIPSAGSNMKVTLMLLNNFQFIRYGVQSLFEAMGGAEDAGPNATEELQDLQSILTKQLNSWCPFIIKTQKDIVWSQMKRMQEDLMKFKAQGPSTREDAKVLVEQVLDELFVIAKTISDTCEKATILPKLIKELWYTVMEGFQYILLPNLPNVTGKRDQENYFFSINYNQRQCALLDHIIDLLKDFFMDDNVGVKESTLERNVKQMKAITKLYRQTTDCLIGECLKSFKSSSNSSDGGETFGEVALELNIARRPASGGMDGTLRVISPSDIKPLNHHGSMSNYKISVDFNFIFPNCQQFSKYRYSTSCSAAMEINQTFKFTLPPTDLCELQATVKHKALIGGEQVLGVASVPFDIIMKSRLYTMNLNSSLLHNEKGRAFLTVLALRSSDEIARDFVTLRTHQRQEMV